MPVTIKCKQCGHDNMLGDIFCRECGAELDLEALDPGKVRKRAKKKSGCLKTSLELLFIFLILFGIAFVSAFFISPFDVKFPQITDDVPGEDLKLAEQIGNSISGENAERFFQVKPEQAATVFKNLVLTDRKYSDSWLVIRVNDEGVVSFFFKKLYYGFPVTISVVGHIEDGDQNDDSHWQLAQQSTFVVSEIKFGLVPVGIQSVPFLRKHFLTFLEEKPFTDIRAALGSINFDKEKKFALDVNRQGMEEQ